MRVKSSTHFQAEAVGQLITQIIVEAGEKLVVEPEEGTTAFVVFLPAEKPGRL